MYIVKIVQKVFTVQNMYICKTKDIVYSFECTKILPIIGLDVIALICTFHKSRGTPRTLQ